ncbi:hypothetical protein [Streptomyces ardesiacus]|uniref:HEAT repeat domain-containing protein n=1 Tax=Streptomyces ardesiacus TaxID=285564 RepID=A0ABW8HM03_9ACTN
MLKQMRPLLDDPAAEVVRETASALLPSAKELPADWLLERTSSQRPRHVRVGAFRLLDAHGGIVVLRAAVGLLADPDMKLRTWAAQSVQRWRPSPDGRRVSSVLGGDLAGLDVAGEMPSRKLPGTVLPSAP